MTDLLVTVGRMKKGLAITLLIPGLIGCAGTPPASTVPTFGGAPGNPSAGPTTQASAGPDVDVAVVAAQIEAQPHETVVADDGSAELLIPTGALPSDVNVADISIKGIEPSSAGTVQGMPIVAAWDMQPAGLHFSASTLLRVRDPAWPADTMPLLVSASDDGTAMEGLAGGLVGPAQHQEAVGVISHFSKVLAIAPDLHVTLANPGRQDVGESFDAVATVSVRLGARLPGTILWAESEFRSQGDASLSPLSVGVPKREVEASYGDTAKFQCNSAGEAELRYETTFSWVFRATSVEGRETLINATTDDSGDVVFDCTGPETPQPTPVPTYVSSINPNLQRHLSVTAGLNPGRDGGDGGGISLYPNDRGTLVIVDAKGTPDGAPVTLNKDGCTATGALVAGLNPTLGGESITQVGLSLADLLSGAYAVNVGVSEAAPDKNLGCGVIPKGKVFTLGPGPGGDQAPAIAVLVENSPVTQVLVSFVVSDALTQPASLITARCPATGTVAFPLSDARGGVSETDLYTTVDDLLAAGLSVQVGRSAQEPDAIVVCGDLTAD